MSVHLSIARAAQIAPHDIAIRSPHFEQSWDMTAKRVAKLAAGLHGLGRKPGDRLAILAGNSPIHMELTYASFWAGVPIVPINTRLSVPEMCQIVKESGASGLAYDRANSASALSIAGSIGGLNLIAMDGGEQGADIGQMLTSSGVEPVHSAATDMIALYFTGGTTGRPKGVELSYGCLHAVTQDLLSAAAYNSSHSYLHAAPYFHLTDSGIGHAISYARGTHVFIDQVTPQSILSAIELLGVNTLTLVPTMYLDLMDYGPEPSPLLRNVVNAVYGSAPITPDLLKRMLKAFPNAEFRQGYGQTEMGGACCFLPPSAHKPDGDKLSSVGVALNGVHLRIADENGIEMPRGRAGEIQVRGNRIMTGYYNQEQLTRETIVDGWLKSGDIGVMDKDGFVSIVDRKKDMIVSGGENVFCSEVENALSTHPSVSLAAVIGIPHPRWGEAVHAYVVASEGCELNEAELIEHTRHQIAGYKCPKSVSIVPELPLSAVGKVRKDILKRDWAS
ncbi:class I adenylate-forming enzyme family protein [Ruegeria sp.]|uniref:class I adenylate-forming enzyme family protein n=1 Tax=Ruegeria sp. TaxID=1879320 RepID=UPI003C7CAFE2